MAQIYDHKQKILEYADILENTNLKQIIGHFSTPDGHCALGVLLHSKGWNLGILPLSFMQDLIMEIGYGTVLTIRSMNDSGRTFKEIAEYMRCEANQM